MKENQESLTLLRVLAPLGRVSYSYSRVVQVSPFVRMNSAATLCIQAMSDVNTQIPLSSPLNKALFVVSVKCLDLSLSSDHILWDKDIKCDYWTRQEALAHGMSEQELNTPPLSTAHFIIRFTIDQPLTYRINVKRPFTRSAAYTSPNDSSLISTAPPTGEHFAAPSPAPSPRALSHTNNNNDTITLSNDSHLISTLPP